MTPRQSEIAWALGVVLFAIFSGMWAATQSDFWGIASLAILAPWFLYTGLRTTFDKKYRLERALWAERLAADADGKPFNRAKAQQRIQETGTPELIWAPRGILVGLLLFSILLSLIARHVPILPTLQ